MKSFFHDNYQKDRSKEPKYAADVPEFLLTPDKVETDLLGDLEFFDGMPRRIDGSESL
jgi:hypothetical protein